MDKKLITKLKAEKWLKNNTEKVLDRLAKYVAYKMFLRSFVPGQKQSVQYTAGNFVEVLYDEYSDNYTSLETKIRKLLTKHYDKLTITKASKKTKKKRITADEEFDLMRNLMEIKDE